MMLHKSHRSYRTVEPAMIDEETIEKKGICFIPSMCTHEISYLETPAESSEHQVSMVAHYQHTFYNSGIEHANDALSKVFHKTSEHYNVQECQVDKQDQELELVEVEATDQNQNLPFISSLVSHQLSDIDI